MAISDVQLKNNYYQVIDENGRKIKEIHASSVGDLLGIGIDFIVFHKIIIMQLMMIILGKLKKYPNHLLVHSKMQPELVSIL